MSAFDGDDDGGGVLTVHQMSVGVLTGSMSAEASADWPAQDAVPGQADPNRIAAMFWDGARVMVVTEAPHGLAGGEHIDITDTDGGIYDVNNTVVGLVITPHAFRTTLADSGTSYGGRWNLT